MQQTVVVDGKSLSIEDVVAVARHGSLAKVSEEAKRRVHQSREKLIQLIKEKGVIYGVTTGFGAFGNVNIPKEDLKQLQVNLIRSHSSGVGNSLKKDETRALMLLRANTLAKGHSGVRYIILDTLIKMINKGVHPVIPEKGSVGASGDLAPLSHMGLAMIGEGSVEHKGTVLDAANALVQAGIPPVELDVKEGVALTNGTQMMTGLAVLAVHDAKNLLKAAEVAAAMSLEALCGIKDAFDERIHAVRPHSGQTKCAEHMRGILSGSRLVRSSNEAVKENEYPQDPYTLRCIPQVLGSVHDTLDFAVRIVEVEVNSATDNPLVFPESGECLSGGNFHGQPISAAMDYLGISLTTVGNFSERRTARLIDERLNRGLPAFLIPEEGKRGIQSGFMTLQYTAAALASENKVFSHPASVDSIPTSANFEDFVSMGPIAARKAREILKNTEYIVAIELLCAAQAVEFRGKDRMGKGTRSAHRLIRKKVPRLIEDRALYKDIEIVRAMINQAEF